MKTTILASLLATLILAGNAFAEQKMNDMDMKGMDMGKKSDATKQTSHNAVGVVKKLDLKAGTVNLDHEAVPSLKWPAMNMTFKVQSPDLLKEVAVGQKVNITFIQKRSGYIITQLSK